MGGQLPWIIRDDKGFIHISDRHTSECKHFITKKFIEESFYAFMYNLNFSIEPLEFIFEFPCHEYGLIVVDYHNKTIVSCNGFSRIGHLYTLDAKHTLDQCSDKEFSSVYPNTFYYDLQWLVHNKRLICCSIIEDKDDHVETIDLNGITWQKFKNFITYNHEGYRIHDPIKIDMSPWVVYNYIWRSHCYAFINKLADIGFPLNLSNFKAFSHVLMSKL